MSDVETHERLAILETKIDRILEALPGQERRLTALERWRSFLLGAWSVLAGLFGLTHVGK